MRAATEPVAGSDAGGGDADRVRVRRDEAGPAGDQPDRAGDLLEAERADLAQHDVVRAALGERVADVVEGGGEAGLAEHEGRAPGALVLQEPRRREGRGPDRALRHVDPARAQPRRQVARRVDRVVREQQEGDPALLEPGEEAIGAGDRVLLVDEDAVHVHQPGADLARHRREHTPGPSAVNRLTGGRRGRSDGRSRARDDPPRAPRAGAGSRPPAARPWSSRRPWSGRWRRSRRPRGG